MSRTLSVNYVQSKIFILSNEKICSVAFNPGKDANIIFNSGDKINSGCMNCMNPRCMNLRKEDIECVEFSDIVHNMSRFVCPVNAIQSGEERIMVDDRKCIGCGLCVLSCPIGAIYLKDGKAKVSVGDKKYFVELPVNDEGIRQQEDFIEKIAFASKRGILQQESDCIIDSIYKSIKKMSQEEQNILARNMLIKLGNHATLARQGNVYMRMDGFYSSKEQFGVVEIETGTDMLDVLRAILDDVAVMNVRYGVDKNENRPLAIVLSLPNKRTDYWQVLKDIKDVIGMSIRTITFGALLILLWNNKEVYKFDRFYIDVDNLSIRTVVSSMIERTARISDGFHGVLENEK